MNINAPVVQEQIKKCVRCGKCRNVCPIFNEYQTENYAPRGQVYMVQMLRDGVVPASEKVAAKLGDCLMCETCTSFCPSAIPVAEMVAEGRAYLNDQRPSTGKKLLFGKLWSSPRLLRTSVAAAGIADTFNLRKAARVLGMTKILPGDLSKAEKMMGKIPRRSARSRLPILVPAQGETKARVGYFLGCGTDLLQPQIALATVNILSRAGCEVVIPPDLKCCGLPHLSYGEKRVAHELVLHNLQVLSTLGVEAIISDCASCTGTLNGHLYQEDICFSLEKGDLANTAQLTEGQVQNALKAVQWLRGKVFDVNQFLIDHLTLPALEKDLPKSLSVTYHDPCHLVKRQKIRQQPRKVIQSVPGVELREMKDADVCCGGSGTFGLTHYDLSMRILSHKIEHIQQTEADVLVTSCPACVTQLSHGLREAKIEIPVMHPMEVLQLGLKDKK